MLTAAHLLPVCPSISLSVLMSFFLCLTAFFVSLSSVLSSSCQSVCLPVSLPVSLSVGLSHCISLSLSFLPSVSLSASFSLSVCPSVTPSRPLLMNLSKCCSSAPAPVPSIDGTCETRSSPADFPALFPLRAFCVFSASRRCCVIVAARRQQPPLPSLPPFLSFLLGLLLRFIPRRPRGCEAFSDPGCSFRTFSCFKALGQVCQLDGGR